MTQARFIRLQEQWNVIYLPERPSGFVVLLLGDNGMNVEQNSSEWEHHLEKHRFLTELVNRGYTVVASSSFNIHWGSEKAFRLTEQLYHLAIKQEIVNKKIHLFAEGAGGLLALRWLDSHKYRIRSCYFVNPCLSLTAYYKQEMDNKFYYKKFLKEVEKAYGVKEEEINLEWMKQISPPMITEHVPPLSIHCDIQERRFPLQAHSRLFQQLLAEKQTLVNLRIHSNEKSFYKTAQSAIPFFKRNERVL